LSVAPNGNSSQEHGASPAIWDQTVLPATQHRWTCTVSSAARQVTWLPTLERWKT